MQLDEQIFHLLVICVVIAVVIATIRKDSPRAIFLAALRLFALTIVVLAGISALLYALMRIPV
jgi:heme A synthase